MCTSFKNTALIHLLNTMLRLPILSGEESKGMLCTGPGCLFFKLLCYLSCITCIFNSDEVSVTDMILYKVFGRSLEINNGAFLILE